jgi:hypothetical protein
VAVEVIEWGSLQLGRRLGQGSEGTVIEARYMDAPVAIKEGAASSEIEMFLAAGVHDNLVGLRGLTRKVGRCAFVGSLSTRMPCCFAAFA